MKSRTATIIKRLYYKDNRLKGFILIDAVEKAGIYTNLIREQTPLDQLDFPALCQKPGLIAFPGQERKKRLGARI